MDLTTEYYLIIKESGDFKKKQKWFNIGRKYGGEPGGEAGEHLAVHGGKYAKVGAAALGAYALYKLYKKWKEKKEEANTPQEKQVAQQKMDQTKAKIDKIKKK